MRWSLEPLKHSITRGQRAWTGALKTLQNHGEGGGSGKGGGSKGGEEEAQACAGALKTLHY